MIIKGFIGPYLMAFFVAEFVLLMQLMWMYIDEILGKGFSIFDVLELLFYFGLSIIPMALPISILIASVMVYGNMSEKYELPILKSAGISLFRSMRGGIVVAILTFFLSLFTSNYLKPAATFQYKNRLTAMRKQKSTLVIEQKIFNDDFRDIVVRTDSRDEDGIMRDVLIYDHKKPDKSLVNLITSDSAKMYTSTDGNNFIMELYSGTQYQEDPKERKEEGGNKYPFTETTFSSYIKVMDLSDFYLDDDELGFSRKREDMLNTVQLIDALDSLSDVKKESIESLKYDYNELLEFNAETKYVTNALLSDSVAQFEAKKIDSLDNNTLYVDSDTSKNKVIEVAKANVSSKRPKRYNGGVNEFSRQYSFSKLDSIEHFYEMFYPDDLPRLLNRSVSLMSSRADVGVSVVNKVNGLNRSKEKYVLRLHQHFSHAFICLIFFFIGAPLGSIIRKGGYGYSLLIAIMFYMIFMISKISGERLVSKESMTGINGAWLPFFLLIPFAIIFTQQALNDKKFDLAGKISSMVNYFNKDKQ